MKSKRILRIALATAFILLLLLLAMQFTNEVVWDLGDFVVAAILLFGAGITYEFLVSRNRFLKHKAVVGIAVAVALILIWMELGVGIFGTPWAGS